MNRILVGICIVFFIICSCKNKESEELANSLQKEYSSPQSIKKLSSGSKAQYIVMEKNVNQRYVNQLDSLINTGFDRQIEKFEDQEMGVISGYRNMLTWLFKSKQSWEDELRLKSSKYFNPLDIAQEQNVLFSQYVEKIKNLRQQFLVQQNLPKYAQYDLPKEDISLAAFSNYSRDNIGIEIIGELLGSELFSWFLGLLILWILSNIGLVMPEKKFGCLVSFLTFIIVIVISVILSCRNDAKLLNQLKEQHQETSIMDSNKLLEELNHNTTIFYEKL